MKQVMGALKMDLIAYFLNISKYFNESINTDSTSIAAPCDDIHKYGVWRCVSASRCSYRTKGFPSDVTGASGRTKAALVVQRVPHP